MKIGFPIRNLQQGKKPRTGSVYVSYLDAEGNSLASASGRFQLQSEVKRFFESFPEFPRDARGEVRNQKVNDTLTHIIYAGYPESEAWGVSLRSAQHEGLISFEAHPFVLVI